MYRPRFPWLQLTGLALCLSAMACGNDTVATTPTPVSPSITDHFQGTLTRNGAVVYTFPSTGAGAVSAVLVALGPDSSLVVGLSLGTWSDPVCSIVLANDKAVVGTIVTGAITSAGNLCARLYDVGNLTQPQTFDVAIVHP